MCVCAGNNWRTYSALLCTYNLRKVKVKNIYINKKVDKLLLKRFKNQNRYNRSCALFCFFFFFFCIIIIQHFPPISIHIHILLYTYIHIQCSASPHALALQAVVVCYILLVLLHCVGWLLFVALAYATTPSAVVIVYRVCCVYHLYYVWSSGCAAAQSAHELDSLYTLRARAHTNTAVRI